MLADRDLESIQEARQLLKKAAEAQKTLENFSQNQIDAVVQACAEAARRGAEPLARLAVEETTYGVVADKVEKNLFAARDVFHAIENLKTVGIIREDQENGVVEIAVPAGVVVAIIPCTNPTSTAIFKALIALKGRNAMVISPHPSAVRCIQETTRVMVEAARQAGAPDGCLSCLSLVTMQATQELMRHPLTSIILATGGSGVVRAAYSSGKPALGVGPGNVPAYVHSSANIRKAVADILTGKCFDNGTLCSAEQHLVTDRAIADPVRAEVERQGGFFLTPQQAEAVARVLILPDFRVNSKLVGHSAAQIAQEAGFSIPKEKRALIAPQEGVGRKHPLSAEKLSPVLTLYVVKDSQEATDLCRRLLEFGGMGHTMSIHAGDDQVIREMALKLPAFRLVVNTPTSLGSVGHTTKLFPSMSLGCGTPGGNITSDNISPMHLINIKRLAYERRPVNRPEGTEINEARTVPPAEPERMVSQVQATNPSPRPAATASEPDRAEIARLVERFMKGQEKATPVKKPSDRTAAPLPATQTSAAAARPAPETPGSQPPLPKAPGPRPVDFVSEDDVRRALNKGEKIYVGPRTIVTPAARDLADPREVLVVVK